MYWKVKTHNFFVTTLDWTINDTDTSWTIYITDKTVNWITLLDGSYIFWLLVWLNNPSEMEIFRITNVSNKTLTYDKRISPNGMNTHISWDLVNLNDMSECVNYLAANVNDFWYTETVTWTGNELKVKVYGGNVIRVSSIDTSVSDTTLTLPNNSTVYIYYDDINNTFNYSTTNLSSYYIVAMVVTLWGIITTLTDYRAISFGLWCIPQTYTASELAALTWVRNWTIVFNSTSWTLNRYEWGVWNDFASGSSPTPRASTTVEWKVRVQTTAEYLADSDIWIDGATLVNKPSNLWILQYEAGEDINAGYWVFMAWLKVYKTIKWVKWVTEVSTTTVDTSTSQDMVKVVYVSPWVLCTLYKKASDNKIYWVISDYFSSWYSYIDSPVLWTEILISNDALEAADTFSVANITFNKIVVVYKKASDDYPYWVVCTVSGTTITPAATPTKLYSDWIIINNSVPSVSKDWNGGFAIWFQRSSNNYPYVVLCAVSWTTITPWSGINLEAVVMNPDGNVLVTCMSTNWSSECVWVFYDNGTSIRFNIVDDSWAVWTWCNILNGYVKLTYKVVWLTDKALLFIPYTWYIRWYLAQVYWDSRLDSIHDSTSMIYSIPLNIISTASFDITNINYWNILWLAFKQSGSILSWVFKTFEFTTRGFIEKTSIVFSGVTSDTVQSLSVCPSYIYSFGIWMLRTSSSNPWSGIYIDTTSRFLGVTTSNVTTWNTATIKTSGVCTTKTWQSAGVAIMPTDWWWLTSTNDCWEYIVWTGLSDTSVLLK